MGLVPGKFARLVAEALDKGEWWAIFFVIIGWLVVLSILIAIGAMVIFAKH
jgi:hypothetical protein